MALLTTFYSPQNGEEFTLFSHFVSLPNGTYIGMLAEIRDGEVDVGAAGFSVTYERAKVVDFSSVPDKTITSLLIKRPNDNDASMHYHTLEFTWTVWIGLLVLFIVAWILMAVLVYGLLVYGQDFENPFVTSMLQSLSICLRAYISKV